MTLANGTLLGPYRIQSPVGAGGMGEVYRAQDTRLGRAVAIKVLPSLLSQDVGFRQRFAQEARAISSLSHPNVCALYDVGSQGGVDFIVMEYLEGESLAARIKKGLLPIEQVLRYGVEVAMALDAAHRRGIIHRDLKPGNVMLTKTGAKLLDFGLATLKRRPSSGPEAKAEDQRLTATGMVIGTLHYMAPEQIEGREADARTDVFALGTVLYEMVSGQAPFTGESTSAVMSAILGTEPPALESLRTDAPVALRRLIKTCLAKDPEERWQTAHDIALQLRGIAEGGPHAKVIAKPTSPVKKGSGRLALTLATLALLLAVGLVVALGLSQLKKGSTETSPIRFELYPPDKATFNFVGFAAAPAVVSPNGRMLAYGGSGPDGKTQLWVRPLGSLASQALPGTDGASYPFWSPDSRSIGFFAQGKLKRVETSGGSPQALCAAPSARGGTWNQQGVIVFAPEVIGPLYEVSARGGIPTPVTVVSTPGGLTHRWPWFLPDGRHFLYLSSNPRGAAGGDEGLYVGSLESKETHRLMLLRSNAVFENGELLYLQDRTLVAQPFDAKTLKIAGEPIPLVHSVAYAPATLRGVFSASGGELLAYATSPAPSGTQLIWYDRQGKQIETLDESVVYYSPELSPDGKQLAVDILEPGTGNVDIWLYQLGNNLKTRFTFGTSVNMSPVWAPDGTQIAFASNRKGFFDLYTRPVNSSGEDEFLLQTNSNKNPTDWSPDGRYLLFEQRDPVQMTKTEIGVLPLFGDRKPFILVASSANVREARFDPSGHWVAYTSDETGRNEVYLTSFPNPGSLRQVSTAGGENPLWGRDGKEIYYLSPDLQMMVAEVNGKGSTLEIGAVRSLFSTHAAVQLMAAPYAVSGDGQKFLIDSLPQANPSSLTIVVNGMTALKASRPGYPQ